MKKIRLILFGVFTLCCLITWSMPTFAKEKTVAFLSLSDFTGPIAGLAVDIEKACEDYFTYINENGGVDGVKIRYIPIDTRYDVARAISGYKRYRKTNKLLVANAVSTPIGKALEPLFNRDKLVWLVAGDGEFVAHPKRGFLWGNCYQDGFSAALDWMAADWKSKGNSGMPTVGYMGWDSAYGRELLRGGKEYAEKIGINLLKPEYFPTGTMDHSTYLTRLKNANYIWVGGIDPNPTNVIRDAHRLGMTKTIQFVCGYWGPAQYLGVRIHNEALQGTVVTVFYLRGNDAQKHPLIKKMWLKYRKKPLSELSGTYGLGLGWALHFEAALKIALKDVGYEKLDGEAMFQAYQKLGGRDITQGIQGICAYGPNERRASKVVRFYQVKGKELVPISGWVKTPDSISLHKF